MESMPENETTTERALSRAIIALGRIAAALDIEDEDCDLAAAVEKVVKAQQGAI